MGIAIPHVMCILVLQVGHASSLRVVGDNENMYHVRSAAIFVQLHNVDKWPELRSCVEHVASACKARNGTKKVALYVAVDKEHSEISRDVQSLSYSSGLVSAKVEVVENRGADIGQFMQQVHRRKPHAKYDLLLKIHSKANDRWRHDQLDALCGNSSNVEDIFRKFEDQAQIGMIGPPKMTWSIHTRNEDSYNGYAFAFLHPGEMKIRRFYHDIYPHDQLQRDHYRIVAGSAYWSRYGPIVANHEFRAATMAWLPIMPNFHVTGSASCDAQPPGAISRPPAVTKNARDEKPKCTEGEDIMYSLERIIPTMIKAHYGLDVI